MNVYQSEAVVLRTYPYAESHKIVVFLTRDLGTVRGIAYGARGKKSKFGSSLELLTYSRVTFSRKQNQELSIIQECDIVRAYPAYQLGWEANLHLSYFAELLFEFANEEEESENLFRLTVAVLDSLREVSVPLLARYFELWLLNLEGILPSLEEKLHPQLASRVVSMLRLHPSKLAPDFLSTDDLNRLERLSEELIERHLEKSLKTRRMLKQLL